MGRINNKFDLESYEKIKDKLDELTLLKHNKDQNISLTYIIMAPAARINDYVSGATTIKRHFAVGAKFILKLGAFSKDMQNNLTLHNMTD